MRCIFLYIFKAIWGQQQNREDSKEISHILPALTQKQPLPFSFSVGGDGQNLKEQASCPQVWSSSHCSGKLHTAEEEKVVREAKPAGDQWG